MAFDGIVVWAMTRELEKELSLGKIEKIYQPEKDELLFFIHTKQGKKKLYLSSSSSHYGLYLTEDEYENPSNPSGFCMLLRKHLQGSKITEIIQVDRERIVELYFESRDEMGYSVAKKLIIEIMGKHSNIILVDIKTKKIIDSIKRISIDVNRARQILPGIVYTYPPTQNKIPFTHLTPSFAEKIQKSDSPAEEALTRLQGLSPLMARELTDFSSGLTLEENIEALTNKIMDYQLSPTVYLQEDGSPFDFHIVPIEEYKDCYTALTFDTISQLLSYYYTNKQSANRIKQKSSSLEKSLSQSLKKLYLKKQRLSEDLLQAEQAKKYQLYGELITANMYMIHLGDTYAKVDNYYTGEKVTLSLDPLLSPSQNAQKYYKKYNKAKRALVEKNIQLQDTTEDILYLKSVESYLSQVTTVEAIEELREELWESGYAKKNKKEKKKGKKKFSPLQYITTNGLPVLVGRNNKENDYLTFKMADRQDLWFHTKDIPGSHVVLITKSREPSEKDIEEAAIIAAFHSKGQDSENVPVDYTKVRYVKKPSNSKPGMVIFTHNRTLFITPKAP